MQANTWIIIYVVGILIFAAGVAKLWGAVLIRYIDAQSCEDDLP